MKKLSCIVLVVLALSGCSSRYSSNGENVYLESRNGVKLQVPPPLTSENISHLYDLPQQNENPQVSIAPPGE